MLADGWPVMHSDGRWTSGGLLQWFWSLLHPFFGLYVWFRAFIAQDSAINVYLRCLTGLRFDLGSCLLCVALEFVQGVSFPYPFGFYKTRMLPHVHHMSIALPCALALSNASRCFAHLIAFGMHFVALYCASHCLVHHISNSCIRPAPAGPKTRAIWRDLKLARSHCHASQKSRFVAHFEIIHLHAFSCIMHRHAYLKPRVAAHFEFTCIVMHFLCNIRRSRRP